MTEIICLANSFREGGRCVAGIDTATGNWIRPVPKSGGAIPTSRLTFNGQSLEVLDIIQLDVKPQKQITKFQRENYVVTNWDWKIVGKAKPGELLNYCDDGNPILFTDNDRVSPKLLEKLSGDKWESLRLVQPRNVKCEPVYKSGQWRARFKDSAGNEYALKVTDLIICDRLNDGEDINSDCILTISLGEPWEPPDKSIPEHCYKLVAAAIEV